MSTTELPKNPTGLAPANNTALAKTVSKITLSWAAVPGPGTYALRAEDLTEPALRHPGNNCPENKHYLCVNNLTQTSFDLSVKPGHRYHWWVHKVNEAGWSQPTVASFTVGQVDEAEIVEQVVPEIIVPGAQAQVSVAVRNTGTTTWKPASGYQLGSQNPVDNKTWGADRIDMQAGAVVRPGETYTFRWDARAPQTQGKYKFQWRMVRAADVGFGQATNNRIISVKRRVAAGSWVTRDLTNGHLVSLTDENLTLMGGHYHLFERNSQGPRQLLYKNNGEAISLNYGLCYPCAPDPAVGDAPLPASTLLPWEGELHAEPWADLFDEVLGPKKINLLRIFLFNGFGIKDGERFEDTDELYPFNTYILTPPPPTGTPPEKIPKAILLWKVKDAIENDRWNNAYFQRLRSFGEKARDKGVFLQLSLFNYYELSENKDNHDRYASPWLQSFWNPARSHPRGWGADNLINLPPDKQGENYRQSEFMTSQYNNLRNTQEKIVRKVVKELHGLPNIILEVMNEPHQGTHEETSKFSSSVVGWIIDESAKYTPAWRPLISVNASRRTPNLPNTCTDVNEFDVDWWATNQLNAKNYEEVDIISYHGLTGYDAYRLNITCECKNPARNKRTYTTRFPPVDLKSINERYSCFKLKHPGKALMMSTDAVGVDKYNHFYGENDMNLRDGQIITGFGHSQGTDNEKKTHSYLENWAHWCFKAKPDGGVVHFQNHSTFEDTYALISRAFLNRDE